MQGIMIFTNADPTLSKGMTETARGADLVSLCYVGDFEA
jgi:hypothetical protein